MREEVIQLFDHFKGLSDAERVIVWHAITIEIMSRVMNADTYALVLLFREAADGEYIAQVRAQRRGEISDALMDWRRSRLTDRQAEGLSASS
jgi:hypothetical protein